MSSKRTLHGVLWFTLDDDSKKQVYVYKRGRSITLDDGGHPLGKIVVHPSNEATVEGWVREYKLCRPSLKIKDYVFLLPDDKP